MARASALFSFAFVVQPWTFLHCLKRRRATAVLLFMLDCWLLGEADQKQPRQGKGYKEKKDTLLILL